MDEKTVPEQRPVLKFAEQLAVGDSVLEECLPYRFNKGPAVVVFKVDEPGQVRHTFFAYRYPNGVHDSATVESWSRLQVYPADTGLAYSRADEDPQPVAGRTPLHMGAVTEVGLVEVHEDDGCPKDADGRVVHDLECAEDREMAELDAWTSQPHAGDIAVVDEGGHTAVAGGLIEIDPPRAD